LSPSVGLPTVTIFHTAAAPTPEKPKELGGLQKELRRLSPQTPPVSDSSSAKHDYDITADDASTFEYGYQLHKIVCRTAFNKNCHSKHLGSKGYMNVISNPSCNLFCN
jgi:hypothetical protein